jgi:hypothetical protein
LVIYEKGNGYHKERLSITVATAAAAGIYAATGWPDKPGCVMSAVYRLQGASVADNNFVTNVTATLPVVGAIQFGTYVEQFSVRVWQLGAAAQNVYVLLDLVIQD